MLLLLLLMMMMMMMLLLLLLLMLLLMLQRLLTWQTRAQDWPGQRRAIHPLPHQREEATWWQRHVGAALQQLWVLRSRPVEGPWD